MPFTPGPWRLDSHAVYIFGPHTEMIATVRGTGEGLPERENGMLLAAAPELYEACKQLTLAIVAIRVSLAEPRDEREHKAVDELRRLWTLGKAAIAKAEGKDNL